MATVPATLPRAYYLSEDIFRQEIARIFYEKWVCVGRAERVPEPGDYCVQPVGDESILIVRGQDGRVRAFYNVCRHRGSPLCTQAAGRLPGAILCPYHAWRYGLDGQLISAPHMREITGFDRADYPLHPVALEVWEGFLFLSLSRDPEPFAPLFAPVAEKLRPWGLAALRSGGRTEDEVGANWKLLTENNSDCYHCPLVHPEFNARANYNSTENDRTEGILQGGYQTFSDDTESLTLSKKVCAPILGSVSGVDLRRAYFYGLFPNVWLSLHPDHVILYVLWPLAPDRTRLHIEWLFDPAALEGGRHRPEDAIGFGDVIHAQDYAVVEAVQQGIRSRVYTPGPSMGEHEELVPAFDKEVLRALGHPLEEVS